MSKFFHRAYDQTWGTVDWGKEENPLEAVKSLLAKGAKVNDTGSENESILLNVVKAHKKGWEEAALFLIENGANVNLADKNGDAPLINACRYKDGLNVVKALVGKGAKINQQLKGRSRGNRPPLASSFALKAAVFAGNDETVDFLIASGANVRLKDDLGQEAISFVQGKSKSNLNILKSLIKAGADVNVENYFADTPLMQAAGRDDLDSFIILKEAGADINKKTKGFSYDINGNFEMVHIPDHSVLSVPVSWGYDRIIDYAMKNGAEVDDYAKKAFENLSQRKDVPQEVKDKIAGFLKLDNKQVEPSKAIAEAREKLKGKNPTTLPPKTVTSTKPKKPRSSGKNNPHDHDR